MAHYLQPLLAPRAVAFMGASPKADSPGNDMLRMIKRAGFKGAIYPLNPKYPEVEGFRCYASLKDLPETVDHVVLSVANARLEAAVDEAIAHGAKAATIKSISSMFAFYIHSRMYVSEIIEQSGRFRRTLSTNRTRKNTKSLINDIQQSFAITFHSDSGFLFSVAFSPTTLITKIKGLLRSPFSIFQISVFL